MTDERTIELNMGPQHPSTHGVLRLQLQIKGDTIIGCTSHIGYLHRCIEKLTEKRYYFWGIPLTNRADYVAALHPEHLFVQAVEKLLDIEPSDRTQYIRVILLELQRIASHLVSIGSFVLDIGQMTTWMWCFREREMILKLMEEVTGGRLFHNWMRFGGIKHDLPKSWTDKCSAMLNYLEKKLLMYQKFVENEVFLQRTKNIATISKKDAMDWGLHGPSLRGSGWEFDARKYAPYLVYSKIDFNVIVEDDGDSFARYRVRYREMLESIKIIRQAIKDLPQGSTEGMRVIYFTQPVKAGEVYVVNEQARGEGGLYLISDGTNKPYRAKYKAPSFCNVAALSKLIVGHKIADIVAIIGSLDPIFGEVDR